MALVGALGAAVQDNPMSNKNSFSSLYKLLGYIFSNETLLREALTHASSVTGAKEKTYERLEFLGDRVLGLAVAEYLFKQQHDAKEGELAPRHTYLVRAETCAKVAGDLGLGDYLILGTSELQSGGRKKAALLSDACEAVMGAIFLDGGYEAARDFVYRHWKPYFEIACAQLRDAKTLLQEWAQAQSYPLPVYHLSERAGPDHEPEFIMEVRVANLSPSTGRGSTKRFAEQEAAEKLLKREGAWPA